MNLKEFIICTIHSAENTDDISRFNLIIFLLNKINESIPIVLSLHPRTKNIISRNNLKVKFLILEPIMYLDMIELIKHSSFVMTDSGGLQKETFFLKKNCVILINETKWTELSKQVIINLLVQIKEKSLIVLR